jgi:hypothetical protein
MPSGCRRHLDEFQRCMDRGWRFQPKSAIASHLSDFKHERSFNRRRKKLSTRRNNQRSCRFPRDHGCN